MVNLETAVTDRGTPEPKKFHFRAPPRPRSTRCTAAGVDVVLAGQQPHPRLRPGRAGRHPGAAPPSRSSRSWAPGATPTRRTRLDHHGQGRPDRLPRHQPDRASWPSTLGGHRHSVRASPWRSTPRRAVDAVQTARSAGRRRRGLHALGAGVQQVPDRAAEGVRAEALATPAPR